MLSGDVLEEENEMIVMTCANKGRGSKRHGDDIKERYISHWILYPHFVRRCRCRRRRRMERGVALWTMMVRLKVGNVTFVTSLPFMLVFFFLFFLFSFTNATNHTNNWAVLVSSSRYWFNYRVRRLPQHTTFLLHSSQHMANALGM